MSVLATHEVVVFLSSLAVLLISARLLGEIAQRLRQPAVLGEILAGILLGPTLLGSFAPDLSGALFPDSGGAAVALDGFTTLAACLFLLVAGMEINLSIIWRQGKAAAVIGLTGLVVPFALGFGAAWFAGDGFAPAGSDPLLLSLFFATALAITALPVIAKILMDLNLYRTDLGMIIVAGAAFNDFVGWNIFGVILGLMEPTSRALAGTAATIAVTAGFAVGMLTIGRYLLDRLLPSLQAHTTWPGGVMGAVLGLALACAALTEWLGIHAIFGAFICGVAVGDSRHLREKTRAALDHFISVIFAPIFFAHIGLRVDFLRYFDWTLVLAVVLIATIGKVLGSGLGARLAGLPPRESWAIGFGMNARGAMEIILGLLALQAGMIDERLFVALVVMALVTSATSGSLIQTILRRRTPARFTENLPARCFRGRLAATDRLAAIRELADAACIGSDLDARAVAEAVWAREQLMSTGLGRGLAAPHARIPGLQRTRVAAGISDSGIDFDAPDGLPARLVFLILSPPEDNSRQLEILADVGRTFQDASLVEQAFAVRTYTEFVSLMKSEATPRR